VAQTFAADGFCSLPEAVSAARNNQVTFECPKGQRRDRDVILLQNANYFLANGLDLGGGDVLIRGQGETDLVAGEEMRPFEIESDSVKLEKLRISGGETGPGVDGGNVLLKGGRLALDRVSVLGGAAEDGGNIYARPGTRLVVKRSLIVGGDAIGDSTSAAAGGGIYLDENSRAKITKALIAGNDAASQTGIGTGGGIYANRAKLAVTDAVFASNGAASGTAASGGGLFSDGPLKVRRSLFDSNQATAGGPTAIGGGLSLSGDDPVSIVNSTLVRNEAREGGGIRANGPVSVSHVTFSENAADDGEHLFAAEDGAITVRNSILPSELSGDACAGDTPGAIDSDGFNLFQLQDPDCPVAGSDEVVSDVGLDPDSLEDNGGPTDTIALTAESEAANLVPEAACKPAKGEDQRGFSRPAGRRCDAGAFERGAARN
jgi:hypothetical protein